MCAQGNRSIQVSVLLFLKTFGLLPLHLNDTLAGYNIRMHVSKKAKLELEGEDLAPVSSSMELCQSTQCLSLQLFLILMKILSSTVTCFFTLYIADFMFN